MSKKSKKQAKKQAKGKVVEAKVKEKKVAVKEKMGTPKEKAPETSGGIQVVDTLQKPEQSVPPVVTPFNANKFVSRFLKEHGA